MSIKKISIIAAAFFYLNVSAQNSKTNLAPLPPMGWNSFDCYCMDVTEEQVKENATYMAKHLKKLGYEYLVIDHGWYFDFGKGLNSNNYLFRNKPPQCIDKYGRVIPNVHKYLSAAKGKGLKPLADYVHGLGLKLGIHIMRGIPWEAVEQNTPIKGTKYHARDIATEAGRCGWYYGFYSVDMSKPGAQEYYNSIAELYKEWGIDFIKADNLDYTGGAAEVEGIAKAIISKGSIVMSFSPRTPIEAKDMVKPNAHLWRIDDDMWDDWRYIKNSFEKCRMWQGQSAPNQWADCDMLPLGKLRINGSDGSLGNALGIGWNRTVNEYSRLTTDEKQTLLTLSYIFRSPLMLGGNLPENDSITYRLITNEEALAVNRKSSNNRELRASANEVVWVADDPVSGGKYVALFNIGDTATQQIKIDWNELGITGKKNVRDVWRQKDIGVFADKFERVVPPHGVVLIRIIN